MNKGIIFFIGIFFSLFFTSCSNDDKAIATALLWSNMNSIPESATDVIIEVKGGLFTKEFIITFKADPEIMYQWLGKSNGTRNLRPIKEGNDEIYIIEPKEAIFAEIIYNVKDNRIKLRTFWS